MNQSQNKPAEKKPDATISEAKPYEQHKQDLIAKGSMNPEPTSEPKTLFSTVKAAANKIGLVAHEKEDGIYVGNDEKSSIKVKKTEDGKVVFETLFDQECTDTKAGTILWPSSQDNVAEHAATAARDMFRRW